jgi:hypothetical protein
MTDRIVAARDDFGLRWLDTAFLLRAFGPIQSAVKPTLERLQHARVR